MSRQYFELQDDLDVPGRWHLRHLVDAVNNKLDTREFRYGNCIDSGLPLMCRLWNDRKMIAVAEPLTLYQSYDGKPLDFTYTDSEVPVATKGVARILGKIAGPDIQRFPVRVDRIGEQFEIINVISVVDCLDIERSEVEWFVEGDDIRPDLAGEPSAVSALAIDPNRVGDHQIFRIQGWTLPVIVSETMKQALEEAQVSGVRFKPVT